jgi:hypothetical protein
MAIVYLEVDDEITTAAARIRTAIDPEVVLVLPAGSRIATSRINFRLLAHEATGRGRRLAVVAPEASSRALAASAGLPTFATIPEYEGARAVPAADETAARPGPPVPDPDRVAAAPAREPIRAASGSVPGAGRVPGARQATGRGADESVAGGRGGVGASTGLAGPDGAARSRRRRWPLLVALLLGVVLLAGAGAAVGYVVLPTATVTLRLVAVPVGPLAFEGTADPAVAAPDPATATIPALRVVIPLAAAGTFESTGRRVEEAAATGSVRWTNCDPGRSYTIPAGTVVRTAAGIGFETRETVLVPVAIISGTPPDVDVRCQLRETDVVAIRKGPAGNVEANTITVVPGAYNPDLVRVTNPAPTSGGIRQEFPLIAEEDVTAAMAALIAQLDAQLTEAAANPPGLPEGATAYPETARRGDPVPSELAADLVGREVETFELALTAEGHVVAADPAPLVEIGRGRLVAEVPAGMEIREDSLLVEIGQGMVDGETIRFPVSGRAEAVREITDEEVRALVKGLTAAEAKAALAPYGSAEVVLWPDWATTVTILDLRLQVTVVPLDPITPVPSPSP